jgi:hypothetical protein
VQAKSQRIVKQKAPVQLTGGAGFRYENPVAARFLLDMLAGTNALGAEFGGVMHVDWQARDSGWLADDLAVSCRHSSGARTAGISIKSPQQVTRAGFPDNFVATAWAQWFGVGTEHALRNSNDIVVLVTGSLTHEVEEAWSNFLFEALKTTPDRMAARLIGSDAGDGSQTSVIQRALFASFCCPEALRRSGETDATATVKVMSRVRLLHFDYEATPSRALGHALADCQAILKSGDASEAEKLWRRLTDIADENRPAGGSIDLPKLLNELRGEFDLRDHPDYRRDWEVLQRLSLGRMADVRTQIGGLPALPRAEAHATIQTRLEQKRACFLVGESGCGKSALAKDIGQTHYKRVVWIGESTFDYATPAQFESGAGISHPLVEILTALPEHCLIVFDGIERFSEQALRLACRVMQEMLADGGPQHVHILATAQFEAADRLIRRFVEFGAPSALHRATPVSRPSESEVQGLIASIDGLQWASLRPELRPLLTNLKILDWVVIAARSGAAMDDPSFVGLTSLIDALWERWVVGDDSDGLGRSRVLKHLGILEGDTLSAGIASMQLEQSEQGALAALAASDLVRVRDERVRFSHDLLGDWARMRVLVGEQSLSSPAMGDRANLPRWHRAVRLYGQRLLEGSADGPEQWRRSIEGLDTESPTGSVVHGLFLESLFLATNAWALLERSWPALIANGGALLNRMLNRFLFVATLPDPRMAAIIQGESDGAQWEHLLRVPYWPYWGPMLAVLHAHSADVVRLAPHTAAKLCALWLRTTPTELSPGQPMPWRREAAELAVAIGREIQALNAEGNYFSDRQDKFAYEAVLWAAPELPDDVAQLCLELAQRRDLNPEIRERVARAQARRREERRQWLAAHPERKRAPPPPSWPMGESRDPWPDGPRSGVDTDFQDACLNTSAFSAFARAKPDAAVEVLLAVCIEEPQHETYSRSSMPETGLDHWNDAEPPLYCRGPFLPFLRQAPEQGLSFVLRLVNFATSRFAEGQGLTLTIGNESRMWLGNSNVFRWHFDWPVPGHSVLHCVLMALERWLYEQIDRGEDITPWVARILRESESLAFAGLLLDVGKYQPSLFAGVLKPLIRNWILLEWDRQVSTLRQQETGAMGYWASQPAQIVALGREWFAMPHRRNLLLYLNGAIVDTMIGDEQHWPFFEQLRAEWSALLDAQDESEKLRLMIERVNPANYTFEMRQGRRVPVGFEWPESIARQNAEDLRKLGQRQTLTHLPFQCRRCLDAGTRLPPEQILRLWEFIRDLDANPPELAERDGEGLFHIEDILCAGIAVLVVLHADLLAETPDRMAWCRQKLEAIVQNPPATFRFDAETAPGDRRWDAFAAEAGVVLLAEDREDALARRLVAAGVMSFHYSTTALTLSRGCQSRERLGEDFDRMLALAVRWAGLRAPYSFATRPTLDKEREGWEARKRALVGQFVDRQLPTELPDIDEINATAAEEIETLQAEQFPEMARMRAPRSSRRPGKSRESLYPEHLRLDSHVISAAFAWLDLRSASPDERRKWLGYIRNFLDILVGAVPKIDDPQQQEVDGLPDDFHGWVFGIVAAAIPCLTAFENPRSLWQTILDLGSGAHHWVERFFWYWFTDGLRAAQSPEQFTRLWTDMVQYALASPAWDPDTNHSYDLATMVCELLGFDLRMNKLGKDPAYASALAGMENVFAAAAQRWFGNPRVVNGFLNFVTEPAASALLPPSIKWLAAVVPAYDSYDWKYGLEENLIAFLHTCWESERQRISADPATQTAFLALLACVVSRGGHSAIALRDRVVNSAAA